MNPLGSSPLHGIICLWYGQAADVPDGWVICDGENGTPDLRSRFILGSTDYYYPGRTLGSWTHKHNFTSDSKDTYLLAGDDLIDNEPHGDYSQKSAGHAHSGPT